MNRPPLESLYPNLLTERKKLPYASKSTNKLMEPTCTLRPLHGSTPKVLNQTQPGQFQAQIKHEKSDTNVTFQFDYGLSSCIISSKVAKNSRRKSHSNIAKSSAIRSPEQEEDQINDCFQHRVQLFDHITSTRQKSLRGCSTPKYIPDLLARDRPRTSTYCIELGKSSQSLQRRQNTISTRRLQTRCSQRDNPQGFDRSSSTPRLVAISNDMSLVPPTLTASATTSKLGTLFEKPKHKQIMLDPTQVVNLDIKNSARSMTTWLGPDKSNVFLTDVNTEDVSVHWTLARSIVYGAWHLYGRNEFQLAIHHFANVVDNAQKHNNLNLMALGYHHLGIALQEQLGLEWKSNSPSLIETCNKRDSNQLQTDECILKFQNHALALAKEAHDPKIEARCQKALGIYQLNKFNYEIAKQHQYQALNGAVMYNDKELQARIHTNLGNIAMAQQQYNLALTCFQKDLSLSKELGTVVGQYRAHHNLSLVYFQILKPELGQKHKHASNRILQSTRHILSPFEMDMKNHKMNSVGNIYQQLSEPEARLNELIVTCIDEVVQNDSELIYAKSHRLLSGDLQDKLVALMQRNNFILTFIPSDG